MLIYWHVEKHSMAIKTHLSRLPLVEYELTQVMFPQICAAEVKGTATIGETSGPLQIRWCLDDNTDSIDSIYLMARDDSTWRIAQWAPELFIRQTNEDTS